MNSDFTKLADSGAGIGLNAKEEHQKLEALSPQPVASDGLGLTGPATERTEQLKVAGICLP